MPDIMDFKFKILLIINASLVLCSPLHRQKRLTLAETVPSYYIRNINGNPGTYSFGYDVSDASGSNQFRNEERLANGTVIGSYGYLDSSGRPYRYRYIADHRGYRVSRIKPEDIIGPSTRSPPFTTEDSITWTRPKRPQKKPNIQNAVESSQTSRMDNSLKLFYKTRKSPSMAFRLY